jgi:predicted ATPase
MKRNGQVTLSVPLAEIELGVPDSLSGVIELQLDRLSDGDRSLLEAGSISGTIFPAWAAAAALERELEDVEEAYAALVRRVRLLSIAGQDELPDGSRSSFYVFAHALYREVLYARLPAARRAQWHLRVAARLRSMFAGQEASVAHEIAAHTAAGSRARSA